MPWRVSLHSNCVLVPVRTHFVIGMLLCVLLCFPANVSAQDAPFEEAVHNVGSVGLTVTNAGFFGRANVRNNPSGPPSFQYPQGSGVEHLFEAGLWIGAFRSDGVQTVRTGAITSSTGYRPGAAGYEFAQLAPFFQRSTLPESPFFVPGAVSHQDFITSYTDTTRFLPGTRTPMPDFQNRLGIKVEQRSFAWNFPFAEYFVIVETDIINLTDQAWDSVYVGLYHNLVVRNVLTTLDTGTPFFNKGGLGFIDSLQTSYAFNAGGTEEGLNTYGAISYLGGDWRDPRSGQRRFFHPNAAAEFIRDGLTPPTMNPRWWFFAGAPNPDLNRPQDDLETYERMALAYPSRNSPTFAQDSVAFYNNLRILGLSNEGNWIGMTSVGPFPSIGARDTLRLAWAFVAARKPQEFQGLSGRGADTPEARALLINNVRWARRIFAGEDRSYTGRLDPGEDINGNGRLDRYLFPTPPAAPRLRVELDAGKATLYWDESAERSVDPVTGIEDFEGYRVYMTRLGSDRGGDFLSEASLFAQYDRPGNRIGFNTGFSGIRIPGAPVTFPGDPTPYVYKLEIDNLLSGWQYGFSVSSFDEGDPDAGLESLESSRLTNAIRVFPGSVASSDAEVGVFPNPYRVNAAWDGGTNQTRKLYFYNLPQRAEIRVYTLAGEIVAELNHEGGEPDDRSRWYTNFSDQNRLEASGQRAWDLLSESRLNVATGLYLYTVRDVDTGRTQTGRFAIIK